jgi:arginyl-tRNA synthetase
MQLSLVVQHELRRALSRLPLVADPEPFVAMVRATQDPKHGDYQANCAMSLAKVVNKGIDRNKPGMTPREIAQDIADRFDPSGPLEKPEVAGPGFINVRFRSDWLAGAVGAMAKDPRLGITKTTPKTYVIDFSGPNVAKPMHVGHLRSTIIGDALARLLRHLGHTVITDNHLGDWGTQFGILLYGFKHHLDKDAFAADPVRELARLYVKIRGLESTDEDEEKDDPIADAYRAETAKLHAGDAENLRLWQDFMPACLDEIDRIYRRLDVVFDHTYGESFYNPMLPSVVDDLLSRGIARESNGAIAIFHSEKEHPALVRKKDGAFTYTTTDLATIRYRVDTWKPDAILYVVDFRQGLHFKNLFAAARRWGYDKVALEHVSFGSVLEKTGRPFSTRKGGAPELGDLLDEAVERAAAMYEANLREARERGSDEIDELSAAEKKDLYEAIGVGAVKYADLSQNRTSDYKFDFDKMIAMTGNTAAYMQYAYARNRSIFRKADADVDLYRTTPPHVYLESDHERALAVQLLRFEEALRQAEAELQPSVLTSYLWDTAKVYSGFFQNCPVVKAPTPLLRESRLLLCDLTARVLQQCLALLGIRTVERM